MDSFQVTHDQHSVWHCCLDGTRISKIFMKFDSPFSSKYFFATTVGCIISRKVRIEKKILLLKTSLSEPVPSPHLPLESWRTNTPKIALSFIIPRSLNKFLPWPSAALHQPRSKLTFFYLGCFWNDQWQTNLLFWIGNEKFQPLLLVLFFHEVQTQCSQWLPIGINASRPLSATFHLLKHFKTSCRRVSVFHWGSKKSNFQKHAIGNDFPR